MIKRLAVICALMLYFGIMSPAVLAQNNSNTQNSSSNNNDGKDHGTFGVYADYFRLQFAGANMFGVGGRAGYNLFRPLAVEAEMSYDFARSTTQSITTGTITSTVTSNLRLIHGLVGPKLQITKGPIRFFAVAKAGILNFGVSSSGVTTGAVTNQIANIRDGNTKVAYYPGGGIEFNLGRFGLRLEAGDEIFFDNGANHNLKVMAGPQIRF